MEYAGCVSRRVGWRASAEDGGSVSRLEGWREMVEDKLSASLLEGRSGFGGNARFAASLVVARGEDLGISATHGFARVFVY